MNKFILCFYSKHFCGFLSHLKTKLFMMVCRVQCDPFLVTVWPHLLLFFPDPAPASLPVLLKLISDASHYIFTLFSVDSAWSTLPPETHLVCLLSPSKFSQKVFSQLPLFKVANQLFEKKRTQFSFLFHVNPFLRHSKSTYYMFSPSRL